MKTSSKSIGCERNNRILKVTAAGCKQIAFFWTFRARKHLELYFVNNDENCLEASYELRWT